MTGEEAKKEEETAAEAAESSEQMSEEELQARLEAHFREQKVEDVLMQFLVSLSSLAYVKMGLTEETKDVKDLGQASLAINAFKALLDAVGAGLEKQDAEALAGALASMQITFTKTAK